MRVPLDIISLQISAFQFNSCPKSRLVSRFSCIWKALWWKYFKVFFFYFNLFSDIENSQFFGSQIQTWPVKMYFEVFQEHLLRFLVNKQSRLSWLICTVLPPVGHHNQIQTWWGNAIRISWNTDVKRYRCRGKEALNKPLSVFDSANERLKWAS